MRLDHSDKDQPACAALARQMLDEALTWFPDRDVILIADAAYACGPVLEGLPQRVGFVGRIRSDVAVYDPTPQPQPKSKPGRKPQKGPRLPSPKEPKRRQPRRTKPPRGKGRGCG